MSGKVAVKLILVGPSGIGKTSLVSCFFKQKFENQTVPTVAPAFCSANIELASGKTIDLQIWDTAGQEQFQSISQMFYRDSQVAFVCFDASDPDIIEQWVERVRTHVQDCAIVLVVTKSDLLSEEVRKTIEGKRDDLVARFNAKGFYVTSASTGEHVRELFHEAAGLGETAMKPNRAGTVDVVGQTKKSRSCC